MVLSCNHRPRRLSHMSEDYIAQYRGININVAFCEKCGGEFFVMDGEMQCCGAKYDFHGIEIKNIVTGKARRKTVCPSDKQRLIESQQGRCYYCERKFGYYFVRNNNVRRSTIQIDHYVPFSFNQSNNKENYVASCSLCNSLKSNMVFPNIYDLRRHIYAATKKKGIEICELPNLQERDDIPVEQDILFNELCVEGLG